MTTNATGTVQSKTCALESPACQNDGSPVELPRHCRSSVRPHCHVVILPAMLRGAAARSLAEAQFQQQTPSKTRGNSLSLHDALPICRRKRPSRPLVLAGVDLTSNVLLKIGAR